LLSRKLDYNTQLLHLLHRLDELQRISEHLSLQIKTLENPTLNLLERLRAVGNRSSLLPSPSASELSAKLKPLMRQPRLLEFTTNVHLLPNQSPDLLPFAQDVSKLPTRASSLEETHQSLLAARLKSRRLTNLLASLEQLEKLGTNSLGPRLLPFSAFPALYPTSVQLAEFSVNPAHLPPRL